MQRYVAFLSGLPVGRDKVDMHALTNLFRKLGFLNVETYLTTGNVAFDTAPVGIVPPLEAQISRHLKRSIDGDIWTFIRTPDELAEIVANMPFTPEEKLSDRDAIFVVLLSEDLDKDAERRLRVGRTGADVLRPAGREIYWLRRATDDASSRPMWLAEFLDMPATVRSLTTITKLAAKSPPTRALSHDNESEQPTVSGRSRR